MHMKVQAGPAPFLKSANVPFEDDMESEAISVPQPSVLDEIGKAWDLLQKGAITDEQYQQIKDGHFRKE